MSEPEKKPKEPAEGEAAPPAAKPAALPLPLLAGVVAGALVAGGALGWFVVAPAVAPAAPGHEAAAKQEAHEKPKAKTKTDAHGKTAEKTSVFRMDNVIVNPAGTGGTRFLMVSVAYESEDEKMNELLHAHEAELRDEAVRVLQRRTIEQLGQPGVRDSIKAELLEAARPIAGPDARVRVFLPQFVLQ